MQALRKEGIPALLMIRSRRAAVAAAMLSALLLTAAAGCSPKPDEATENAAPVSGAAADANTPATRQNEPPPKMEAPE